MALEGYKANNNVVYSSKYHVVWTPKYRRPVLLGESQSCFLAPSKRGVPGVEIPLPTLETNRYFVSTVGGAPLAVIQQYVENQKNL